MGQKGLSTIIFQGVGQYGHIDTMLSDGNKSVILTIEPVSGATVITANGNGEFNFTD